MWGTYDRVRVSDRTRLQKLFISAQKLFTRGFWVKIPVYESCAVGALLGDFGQLWAILGFSGLFLHNKYAVYEGFLAIIYFFFTVTISCKRVLSDTRTQSTFWHVLGSAPLSSLHTGAPHALHHSCHRRESSIAPCRAHTPSSRASSPRSRPPPQSRAEAEGAPPARTRTLRSGMPPHASPRRAVGPRTHTHEQPE